MNNSKYKMLSLQQYYNLVRDYTKASYSNIDDNLLLQSYLSFNDLKDQDSINKIKTFLDTSNYRVRGYTYDELVERMYYELNGLSFIHKYVFDPNKRVENVLINSKDSVIVNFDDGSTKFLDDQFFDVEHVESIVRRMLDKEIEWNEVNPVVTSSIGSSIRITAYGFGVVDDGVGCTATIRIVNPKKLNREYYLENGTISPKGMDLLEKYAIEGKSLCLVAKQNAGKTTLLDYLLSVLPNTRRIASIEEEMRELNIVKRSIQGTVINNTVSYKTTKNFSAKEAVKKVVTNNANTVPIGELKGEEAISAVEVGNAGVQIFATTHAVNVKRGWNRIIMLLRKAYPNLESQELFDMVGHALPIMVHIHLDEITHKRCIDEIVEVVFDDDGDNSIICSDYKLVTRYRLDLESGEIYYG